MKDKRKEAVDGSKKSEIQAEDFDPVANKDRASEPVGFVIGTEDSTPLNFWVGVRDDGYLQLDDAVVVETQVPGRGTVRISGIVQQVRARHEGAQFDTDVFLVDRGVLPVETAVAAA